MNYEYLETLGNGNLRFKITLNLYRDCFQSEVPLDDEIQMGVYLNNSDKERYTIANFSLLFKQKVQPPGNTDCPFYDDNFCIEYGLYEGIIDLPPSSVGYHITFERCCRNKQTNIPDNSGTPYQGQTYYCFIPDKLYQNSSPVFSGVPSPYMCVNDTTIFDFSAFDPDGDDLSYEIVHPYAGASLGNSTPDPKSNFGPIPLVAYNTNFTYTKPFGTNNGSISSVNALTGLTTFFAPSIGSYIVAIEVTESRNGVVLSKVRLDLQILVLNCPPNDRPQMDAVDGQSFIIEEGETLCFDVEATDPDQDDFVKLTAKGPIVDGTNNYTGPRAFFNAVDGSPDASAELCWTPDCDMDREDPYLISVTAIDDGCPSKSNTLDFSITVIPFVGSEEIEGPITVCRYNSYEYFAVDYNPKSSFVWEVDNGIIVGRDDSSHVRIYWDGAVSGKVRMTEISQYGCPGPTTELDVTITESPSLPIIVGKDTVCENEAPLDYQVSLNSGNSYEWFVSNATIGSQSQNTITIGAYNGPDFTIRVVETSANGCPSDTAELKVHVSIPDPDVTGPTTVCPNAQNVLYTTLNNSGSTYSWTVNGGTIVSGQGSNTIRVNWGNAGIGGVSLQETNRHACVSPVNSIVVNKTYILIPNPIQGPSDVCENDLAVPYETLEVNGSVYNWTVMGGTQASGDSSYQITIDWGTAGAARVGVQEKAYDLVNDRECLSPIEYLDVTIHPKPTADEIIGTFELCQFEDSTTYSIAGFPTSSYEWAIDGNSTGIVGQGTNSITVFWDVAGSYVLSVLETTDAGCTNTIIDSIVIVNPKPNTSAISGPDVVCPEDILNKNYSVNGMSGSVFNWTLGGHNNFTGQGTSAIVVDWEPSIPRGYLRVVEVSDKGCVGDTVEAEVEIDRLKIDMRFVSVGTPDNRMIINWKLAERSSVDEFTIQKRVAGTALWQDVIDVTGSIFEYVEKNINTDQNAFEYRVVATNKCGTLISSEVHTSILLQGYQDENFDINISFSPYSGWENGVNYYTVYESINNGPYAEMGVNPLPRENTLLVNDPDQYIKCYRILAYEDGGEATFSWSNDVCFTFDPNVYVPNAFTPNNDNLNDGFGVVGVAVNEFRIQIYNRWGEKIYESEDIDAKWNATYLGKDVQVGTYLYLINFTDFDGKIYQRTGTINLIR